MPTSPIMQIPKSKSAEEFENLCVDVLTKINDIRFTLYGGKGQKQNGIDIYGKSSGSSYIVAQCKNYFSIDSADKLVKKIEEDINATNNLPFYNDISKFIVMTSMDRNNKVQNGIHSINSNLYIELWFWDDIQQIVCKNDDLIQIYYSQIFNNFRVPINDINKIISSINTLKKIAEYFNSSCTEYKVLKNEESDIDLYNLCISMHNTSRELKSLKDKYYLQLKKIGIIDTIENILDSLPYIHDASDDWTGSYMIVTIYDYLKYFCKDSNATMYINRCKQVIKELS